MTPTTMVPMTMTVTVVMMTVTVTVVVMTMAGWGVVRGGGSERFWVNLKSDKVRTARLCVSLIVLVKRQLVNRSKRQLSLRTILII